jgi:hypothetical protein
MPKLTPSKFFLKDLDRMKSDKQLLKKIVKTLAFLETNPLHPGLHIERIVNDPTAWSARVDKSIRLSFEPQKRHVSGNPDWSGEIILLRLLDHDDLYKHPR